MSPQHPVEAPSGKTAADENFPVGSWLLPARLRPHVATFYAFARAADDIADDAELAPDEKVRRLDGLGRALKDGTGDPVGFAKALALRESLAATGVTDRHPLDLLDAFKQDAVKLRYADWAELMDYCARSASPVGRYLVDLHGENPAAYAASDPLCDALQVLNHLQDCQADQRRLDRVYLPLDWLAAEGLTVLDLRAPRAAPGLRRVLDRALDRVDRLLARAVDLPGAVHNRRFAMECAVIVRLARRLSQRLRREDPLAGRVSLSRLDFVACGLRGIAAGAAGRRPSTTGPVARRAGPA